jgi:hypothetical protein
MHREALPDGFDVVISATLISAQQALLHHLIWTVEIQDECWLFPCIDIAPIHFMRVEQPWCPSFQKM